MKNKRHLLILGLLCCVQSSDAMYGNPKNIAAVFLTTLLASTYGKAALSNIGYTPSHFSNYNALNQSGLYGNNTSAQFLSSNGQLPSSLIGPAERPMDTPTVTFFPQSFSNISMPYELFYQPTLTKAQLQDGVSLKTSDGKAQSEVDLEKQALTQLKADREKIEAEESIEQNKVNTIHQAERANIHKKYKEKEKEITNKRDIPQNKYDLARRAIDNEYNGASAPLMEKIENLKKTGGTETSDVASENESLSQLESRLKEMTEKRQSEHDQAHAVYQTESAAAHAVYGKEIQDARGEKDLSIKRALVKSFSESSKIQNKYRESLYKINRAIEKIEKGPTIDEIEEKQRKDFENYIRDLPPEGEVSLHKAEMNQVLKAGVELLSEPAVLSSMLETKQTGEKLLEYQEKLLQYLITSNNDIIKRGEAPLFDNLDADISKIMRMPDDEQKLKIATIGLAVDGDTGLTLHRMHQRYLDAQENFNKAKSDAMKKIDEMNWNPLAGPLTYIWDKMGGLYGVAGTGALALLGEYAQSSTKQKLLRSKKDETIDPGQLIKAATGGSIQE